MTAARCPDPIDDQSLTDYWLRELPTAREESIEEHLFACDECGARLDRLMALAAGVRDLARKGALRVAVDESFLRRAAAAGLRVRQYSVPAGGSVNCTVTSDDDLVVARLSADFGGVSAVDLSVCDAAGAEILRTRDIPVAPGQAEIVFNEPIDALRAAPAHVAIMKLIARGGPAERLLGAYTFNHTPSL